jgi:hypothetical protein
MPDTEFLLSSFKFSLARQKMREMERESQKVWIRITVKDGTTHLQSDSIALIF